MALTNQIIGAGGIAGGAISLEDTNTAQILRYGFLGLLAEGAAGTNGFTQSRPGCLPGPADADTQIPNCFAQLPSTGLSLQIRRGAAVVERSTTVGPYIVVVEATGTVTLATADSINSRIDRVDLQVLDAVLGDGGGTVVRYVVTSGTGTPVAGVIPVAPPPINSIPICQVTLTANATTVTGGMIADKRRSAGLRGGVRFLLPGDSLSDAGIMSGEMRDTTALGGFTIDKWNNATSSWLPVTDLTGAASVIAEFTAAQTVTNVTATAYADIVNGTTKLGVPFIAPSSGIVKLSWGCNAFSGLVGSSLFVGAAVSTGSTIGSGTPFSAANDDEALVFSDTTDSPGDRSRRITGLVPGAPYNAWVRAHNSGSTSSHIDRPFIDVEPRLR